jgi:hypothetical protein
LTDKLPTFQELRVRGFKVRRVLAAGEYKFIEAFDGLQYSSTLLRVFGSSKNLLKVSQHLKLRVEDSDWGPWLDKSTGSICIGSRYMRIVRPNFIYLDVVHVLVHVKQYLDGRDLLDQTFEYVDRPTEIEAYRYTIDEAKKLGMGEEQILRYLRVDTVDDTELGRLIERIGVRLKR